MVLSASSVKVWTETLNLIAERAPHFIDITDDVERAVEAAGIANGFAVVFSRHTTAAIKINEHLKRRGKDLNQVSREEFDDIAHKVGLRRGPG